MTLSDPLPIAIPTSYETVATKFVKISHHPAGAKDATPIIVIALNRPKTHNAFTLDMMHDFEKVYPMLDIDERVKVIVLTGVGKTFCAGADLNVGFRGGVERPVDHRDGGGRLALAIHRCRKPTIAAMQGSAVGIGMTITLPAAIRIAYEGGKYGFVFARRGIPMESTSSYFLPRLIGHARTMYLVTTGGVFPPNSPHFGPLFAETLPEASEVLPRALRLAEEIVENVSLLAWYMNHCLIWRNPGTAEGTHLVDSSVLYHMFSGKDQTEGVQAFLSKRKPSFKSTLEDDAPPNFPWWTEIDTGSRPKASRGRSKL